MNPQPHWVKMVYPGETPIVVCEVRPISGGWYAHHRTKPSQFHTGYNSPGGIDVGTVTYLRELQVQGLRISTFMFEYERTKQLFQFEWSYILSLRSRLAPVSDGQPRTRVFPDVSHCSLWPIGAKVHIPHTMETRIDPAGKVLRWYPGAIVPGNVAP